MQVPDAEVEGRVGRSTSYEVTVNGVLVFSKLKTHGFPRNEDILDRVQAAHKGGSITEVTDAQSPGCSIL